MYDDLIHRLNEYSAEHESHGGITAEAADAIEGLSHAVDQMTEWRKNRWIPVAERLPKEYAEVLVFTRTGNVAFDRLESLVAYGIPDFRKFGVGAVTHWMPLPQPPKEE